MSEVLIRGYKAKEQIEEIIEAAKYGSNNCMIGEGLEIIELPEHGDLIDIRNAENAMFALGNYHLSDYKKGWNDGIKAVIENAPVIVPSNKEALT